MEYQVVVAGDHEKLAEKVNNLIASGWTPQGGVAVTQDSRSWENERNGYMEHETDTTYAQAMVLVVS